MFIISSSKLLFHLFLLPHYPFIKQPWFLYLLPQITASAKRVSKKSILLLFGVLFIILCPFFHWWWFGRLACVFVCCGNFEMIHEFNVQLLMRNQYHTTKMFCRSTLSSSTGTTMESFIHGRLFKVQFLFSLHFCHELTSTLRFQINETKWCLDLLIFEIQVLMKLTFFNLKCNQSCENQLVKLGYSLFISTCY